MAAVAAALGHPTRAARQLGLATAVRGRADCGDLLVQTVTRRLRATLGQAELDRLVAAGSALSREEALAEVGAPPVAPWPGTGTAGAA